MTIAKDFAAKFSVAFVAIAMIFTLVAPAVNAQESSEDLQKTIADLLAQVAELEGKMSDKSTGGSSTCESIPAPLTMNSTGANVTALQNRLIADGESIPAGATGFFGAQTKAALASWQGKNGVTPAAGYYGPITMAAMDASCTPADEDEDEDDEDEDDGGPSTDDLSGAADLEDFEVDDASDTEIEEASEDAEIGELTIRFENGDAEIDRIEIGLLKEGQTNTNTVEPWDVFETLSLWVDGDMIEEIDVDDEDFWLDEDTGTIRFTGLGLVAEEDEDLVVTIGATIQNGLETNELGDWVLLAEEVRFFDADGVSDDDSTTDGLNNFDRTLPFGGDTSDFEIREEGDEDELFVRTSTEDPESTTIELEDDETSDFITIFAFDLDTEDSLSDIQVEGLRVDVAGTEDGTTATSTVNLINDAQLLVDGEEYDDVTIVHGTTGTFTFDLDDEDFFIEAGERVTVEFQVEFEALDPDFEGATVEATTDTDGLSAEGSENLTVGANQLSGSATGEEHTLRSEGVILALESISESLKVNDDQTATDDEGVFTIKVEVTAFENDIYVNKTASRGTTLGTAGANFLIEDSNGVVTTAGTSTASLTSTADTEGTRFIVNEGETETFTLTVEYDPTTQGFYQLQLHSLNFNVANSNPNTQQRALDESDYETDSLSI